MAPHAAAASSSSSSSSSSTSARRHRNRKWTREELLQGLEILGALTHAPLPPELPPSPPASRPGSPVPGSKRKSDGPFDGEHNKRLRATPAQQTQDTSAYQPSPSHRHLRIPSTAVTGRPEPTEDGELHEDAVATSSAAAVAAKAAPSALSPTSTTSAASSSRGTGVPASVPNVPVRRPRRGRLDHAEFDKMHDKYHNAGRKLKYSGDARFWSTYPTNHRDYKALQNPPPPDSPYRKFGGLIARLELIDALVCFAYSIWSKEYSRNQCFKETWATIDAFLGWCKHKWQAEEPAGDREKTFIGLIFMIEAFIYGRKAAFSVNRGLKHRWDGVVQECAQQIADAVSAAEQNPTARSPAGQTPTSHSTPPMLPSPASITQANSANSTPTNRADGTPNTTASGNAQPAASSVLPSRPQPSPVPISMLPGHLRSNAPLQSHIASAVAGVSAHVNPNVVQSTREHLKDLQSAMQCIEHAQKTLTLPAVARHFPHTFARMVHSTLLPHEEYEPDMEDEEGELYWPGQLVTGDGLGWVCLMGKAMVQEMGKELGYMGLAGVVPKPDTGRGPGISPAPGAAMAIKR